MRSMLGQRHNSLALPCSALFASTCSDLYFTSICILHVSMRVHGVFETCEAIFAAVEVSDVLVE